MKSARGDIILEHFNQSSNLNGRHTSRPTPPALPGGLFLGRRKVYAVYFLHYFEKGVGVRPGLKTKSSTSLGSRTLELRGYPKP